MILLIFRLFHPLVAWDNMIGWTAVSAGFFAASLLPWWWAVRRLFDARVAWLSTIIFSVLPQYWQEAIEWSGYPVSFLFIFLGFVAYLELHARHRFAAAAAGGLCLGAAIAANHAFIAFLPWLAVLYLWHKRKQWVSAIAMAGLAIIAVCFMILLPSVSNALRPGMSASERVVAAFQPFLSLYYFFLLVFKILHLPPHPFLFLHQRIKLLL